MTVFMVLCGCGLVFFSRFLLALCTDPSCKKTKVWFIRARMHRVMAEKRYEKRYAAMQKRAA